MPEPMPLPPPPAKEERSQTFSGTMRLNLKQLPKQATAASRKQGPSQGKLVASGSRHTTLYGVAVEPRGC